MTACFCIHRINPKILKASGIFILGYFIPFFSRFLGSVILPVITAAAAVSGEAGSIGPIAAEDVIKLITLGLTLLGVILAPLGITVLVDLLGL